jgi:hypothetical protein
MNKEELLETFKQEVIKQKLMEGEKVDPEPAKKLAEDIMAGIPTELTPDKELTGEDLSNIGPGIEFEPYDKDAKVLVKGRKNGKPIDEGSTDVWLLSLIVLVLQPLLMFIVYNIIK